MTKQPQKPADKPKEKSKGQQDHELGKALEDSFPASDPPASTQPGSGITGPEKAK